MLNIACRTRHRRIQPTVKISSLHTQVAVTFVARLKRR
jgi:hypothetical protein